MSPSASMSSLSHSMKVRSAMAALPIGTVSTSGPRVSTKPPTCCDRWRGKPISWSARSSTAARTRIAGIETGLADVFIRQRAARAGAPDLAGQRGDHVLRQPHRLADLADRRARPIVDDRGGDAGPVAAVALIDVLDHLLAPLVLEVDVDVGRLVALARDEALEQQVDLDRIDRGDAEAIADRRIGGRAAALARMPRERAKRTMSCTVRK